MKAEPKPRDPDWDAKVRASFARQTFMDTIGARIAALSPGRCEVEMPFRADLCQQHGYLHGGVVTAIAANAAGYAAFTLMPANSSVLGVEYKINLLDAAEGRALPCARLGDRAGPHALGGRMRGRGGAGWQAPPRWRACSRP